MKRTITITGIVMGVIVIALVVFNRLASKKGTETIFAKAEKGSFEIIVSNAGNLEAERSVDIKGPEILSSNQSGGGQRGGMGGHMFHASNFKIQDIVAEGTLVSPGDYIAQLDRTEYDNSLKTAREELTTLQSNLEMAVLDTAVSLTNLRDEIRNQAIAVEEAHIILAESKYEPPATIRQAEINLNKQQRALEQKQKNYILKKTQALTDIRQKKSALNDGIELVNGLTDFLAKFTIVAPSPGMVIYKEEFNGTKRKAGSTVNPFDRTVATLPDLTSMISKTYVSEIEVNKVKNGQKVSVTIDAIPGKTWTGSVLSVANIGEVLGNSDAKMFEVRIMIDGVNPDLRPSMTTNNKIVISSFENVTYIPTECVYTGADKIPFVYKKNKTKQIVVLGEMNDKYIIVKKGLEPGTPVYVVAPPESEKFRIVGKDLIASK